MCTQLELENNTKLLELVYFPPLKNQHIINPCTAVEPWGKCGSWMIPKWFSIAFVYVQQAEF